MTDEELLQKEILDKIGAIVLILNKKAEITYINKAGSKILECPKKELIGKNWFKEFIPKKNKKEIKKVFRSIISGKIQEFKTYKNPVLTKGKNEKIILWHNSVLKDKADNIRGTLSSGIDITEQEKTEKKFQVISESAQDAIILLNNQNKIIYWNPAAEKILGYTKKEILGKTLYEIIQIPESSEIPKKEIFDNLNSKNTKYQGKTIKLKAKTKNRGVIPIELSVSVVKINKECNAVCILRDISEREKFENEIKKKNQELTKINEFAIDRELRMVELKKEVNALLKKIGEKPKYKIPE